MPEKLGTMARRDIELMLGIRFSQKPWVKVKKNWRDKSQSRLTLPIMKKEYWVEVGSCLLLVLQKGGTIPELPEVETVSSWLRKIDLGKEDF